MNADTSIHARVVRRFSASPERVFDAWLDPRKVATWIFAAGPADEIVRVEIDARTGGSFTFTLRRDGEEIEHTGQYLEIVRPRRLVFSWAIPKDSPDSDRVSVEIVPLETGCELTLTHELHPEWAAYAPKTEAAWAKMLEALARALA
jgi:uncharacterized protein YndB with AHSA1/START domain